MDLPTTISIIAPILTAVLVPCVGWVGRRVIALGERVVKLETRLDSLESGVAKDVKELKEDFEKLDTKLQAHMDGETAAMRRVFREELQSWGVGRGS